MTKITVNFGNKAVVLKKNKQYAGVKQIQTRSLGPSELDNSVKAVLYPNIGGFKIVSVKPQEGTRGLMSDPVDALRSLDEVEVGTHVYNIAGSDKPLVPTGSIYITFNEKVTTAEQEALLAKYNLVLKERKSEQKLVASVTPQSENPLKCASKFQRLKSVARAEPDIDIPLDHYFTTPSASLWGQMWHLENKGKIPDNPKLHLTAGADAKVVEAWKLLDGFGNPNIVVAVIDIGIDVNHPDLASKIVKPWDFWSNSDQLLANDPLYTHGTPCASVAVAPADGGMCGSAPSARLMPLSGTGFSIESTENMFNYCIEKGADIVSCSWGTLDESFTLNEEKISAITKAATKGRNGKGCVICFAAGNEGAETLNVYGAHPNVICVGATTSDDEHPDYSNCGPTLTICAPSNGGEVPILAARASWDEGNPNEDGAFKYYYGDGIDRGTHYQHFGGTSSATPLVAGICALILSANPNLTAAEVKQILIQTADKVGPADEYTEGYSNKFGYGRVNAAKAVQEAIKRKK
ncbi:MAG: S8 family serine peptidase [Saprospiraceae bacterium]|nr:S8 family serine peptidase [Saprospiraceae bacterium]